MANLIVLENIQTEVLISLSNYTEIHIIFAAFSWKIWLLHSKKVFS